jgi:hypothetical protein
MNSPLAAQVDTNPENQEGKRGVHQPEKNLSQVVDRPGRFLGRINMDFSGFGMAVAAGFYQVRRVDPRARIAYRENVVVAVATRAVGCVLVAESLSYAVEALFVCIEFVSGYIVLGHAHLVGMAAGAGSRDVGPGGRRILN